IVEGDVAWRATLAVVLERATRVETAATVEDALNQMLGLRPTCVILNVRSAPAEARFLSVLHARFPACPVLVLSEDSNLQVTLAWEALNVQAIMRQPVGTHELVGRLSAIIEKDNEPSRRWLKLSVPVSLMIDYLSKHFKDDTSVDTMAKAARISSSHLAHLFRAETGMTVRDYVTRVRVEITRDLLCHTSANLE